MLLANILLILEALIMRAFCKVSPYRRFFPLILMLSFSLVIGLRVDVGIDYQSYAEVYNNRYSAGRMSLEPFWIFFCDFLNFLHFKTRMFFLLTAICSIWGYFRGFKSMSPNIFLSAIIFIACGVYNETTNAVRQSCAQAILFAGTPFLLKREWLKFIITIVCATMLHYSAIIGAFFMLVCILHFSRRVLLIGIILTFFLGNVFMNLFADYWALISVNIDKYNYNPMSHDPGVTSGALRYANNMIGIGILLLYTKLLPLNKNVYFFINLSILGICWYNTFFLFQEVNRLTNYCLPFIMIVIPYVAKLFEPQSRIIAIGMFITMLLVFLIKSWATVPYSFDLELL